MKSSVGKVYTLYCVYELFNCRKSVEHPHVFVFLQNIFGYISANSDDIYLIFRYFTPTSLEVVGVKAGNHQAY